MTSPEQHNPDLPIFGCFSSVRVMAFNKEGSILLVQRSSGEQKGLWELPGGKQDHPNEDPLETGLREFAEEVGPSKSITIFEETVHELPSRKFEDKNGNLRTIFPKVIFGITDDEFPELHTGEHNNAINLYPAHINARSGKFTVDALAAVNLYMQLHKQQ